MLSAESLKLKLDWN